MRNRKSLRLPDFDYSQDGAYFTTIVTQNRVCLFGDIIKGIMVSNDAGKMIEGVCKELSEFIRGVELNPYQIMPNHFHAIVIINQSRDVGATLWLPRADTEVCPYGQSNFFAQRRSTV